MHYNKNNDLQEGNIMPEDNRGRNDLVLAPNEFAYIADETKGNVDVYVGPFKTSLANTDQPVIFDSKTKRFRSVTLEQCVQTSVVAPCGWYLALKNQSKNSEEIYPKKGSRSSIPKLEVGSKINVLGPISFALWPGQMVKVIQGHHIRSNQYLIVRVYDEKAAQENWSKTVVKGTGGKAAADEVLGGQKTPTLTMGNLLVIKGTDVSFYIPPTGIEVVSDKNGDLVRSAVTLERLEYCLLKDENGDKRYVRGPAVVFPEPSEIFIEKPIDKKNPSAGKTRKFRATELNPNSGIYVKVIADYEEDGQKYKQGEELFITGKEQMIYFPRKEHAIIRYEDNEIHYGIAIPAGEGRYVLDRNKGSISLRQGPEIFLPDPRNEVVAKRVLPLKLVELMYPGNQEALEYNANLLGIDLDEYLSGATRYSLENAVAASAVMYDSAPSADDRIEMQTKGLVGNSRNMTRSRREITKRAATGFEGDAFDRKTQYTPTREVMLQTKYSGAVSTDIWSGYAVMLVSKSGNRRVVTGPKTVMLEYDETPQVMQLSTGKPKTTDRLLSTTYLKMFANKVADIITLETKDFCKMNVKLSYRVNFEGDKENWFNVDNYVKFLCDHMRSMLRNVSLQYDIQELYSNVMNIIRDTVLGKQDENGKRTGFEFSENGMRIYDVDVLSVVMENKDVEQSLILNQRESLKQQLQFVSETERLEHAKKIELIKREHLNTKAETNELTLGLQKKEYEQQLEVEKQRLANSAEVSQLEIVQRFEAEKAQSAISSEKVKRTKEEKELLLAISKEEAGIRVSELEAAAQAVVTKSEAITPNLIAALQSYGDQETLQRVAKAMAPMSIIGGESVKEALSGLLAGTPLADKLEELLGSNGKRLPATLKSS